MDIYIYIYIYACSWATSPSHSFMDIPRFHLFFYLYCRLSPPPLSLYIYIVCVGCSMTGLDSLFNCMPTFDAKAILLKEHYYYYITHDKLAYIFPKSICPKMNIIARLEFELAKATFPQSSILTIIPRGHTL